MNEKLDLEVKKQITKGPRVFGKNGYFFSRSLGALLIMVGNDLGSKLID